MEPTHTATTMTATSVHRVTLLVAALTMLAAGFFMSSVPAQAAPFCAYNSTIASCADCSTTGPGVSCTGGQLYRPSDASCYDDPRPGVSNERLDCNDGQLKCNTPAYPCSGCTVVTGNINSSCVGASENALPNHICPFGGLYADNCGDLANSRGQNVFKCPTDTTWCKETSGVLYPSTCRADRAPGNECPEGTTWNPCNDSCDTPYVILNPTFAGVNGQSGEIKITGDFITTAGSVTADGTMSANGVCLTGGATDCRYGWDDISPWQALAPSYVALVSSGDSVGIGTNTPLAKLSVVANGASELSGAAASDVFLVTAGSLGTIAGNSIKLANIGFKSSTNNVSLGIRAERETGGTTWTSSGVSLGLDVDNSPRIGASIMLAANQAEVGINTTTPGYPLDVSSSWGTAVIRLSETNAGNLWTGLRLDRQAGLEKWFLGMDDTSDNLVFRTQGSDRITVKPEGYVGIGTSAPSSLFEVKNYLKYDVSPRSTYIGRYAAYRAGEQDGNNTIIGHQAGYGISNLTTGAGADQNTVVGTFAGFALSYGDYNTFMGYYAGAATTTAYGNIALGGLALRTNVSGRENVAVGMQSNYYGKGSYNISMGRLSMYGSAASTGSNNVALGHWALRGYTTGSYNVAVGRYAGYTSGANIQVTSGNYNTFVGSGAGATTGTLSYATVIGSNASVSRPNSVVLGRAVDWVGIANPNPGYPLDVWSQTGTSIMRLNQNTATPFWVGTTLARQTSEKWFAGMSNADDVYRFRYGGTTDVVTIDPNGTISASGGITSVACFGPVFVGTTAGTYDGDNGTGGYRTVNPLCASFGAGAHVCSSAEVMESIRCEAPAVMSGASNNVDSWIQDGPPGFTAPANDCGGWTSAAGSQLGRKWKWSNTSGGEGRLTTCNQLIKYACCK